MRRRRLWEQVSHLCCSASGKGAARNVLCFLFGVVTYRQWLLLVETSHIAPPREGSNAPYMVANNNNNNNNNNNDITPRVVLNPAVTNSLRVGVPNAPRELVHNATSSVIHHAQKTTQTKAPLWNVSHVIPTTTTMKTPNNDYMSFRNGQFQVFYLNSFLYPEKKAFMQSWLGPHAERLEPVEGYDNRFCQKNVACETSYSLAHSYKFLLDHAAAFYELDNNNQVTTMILHDDNFQFSWKELSHQLEEKKGTSSSSSSWEVVRLFLDFGQQENENDNQTSIHLSWEGLNNNCTSRRSSGTIWQAGALKKIKKWYEARPLRVDLDCQLDPNNNNNNNPRDNSIILNHRALTIPATKFHPSSTHNNPLMATTTTTTTKPVQYFEYLPTGMVPLQKLTNNPKLKPFQPANPTTNVIQRVYYVNLDKNQLRRQSMESFLNDVPVPYKRVSAMKGSGDLCMPPMSATKCIGVSGLVQTYLKLIDQENMTGISLVLEDDFVLTDVKLERIQAGLALVPDDWDIIRLDCWGEGWEVNFPQKINKYVFDTNKFRGQKKCGKWCYFYGGTHAFLLRNATAHRVRERWAHQPFRETDFVLSTPSLKHEGFHSYCLQLGVGLRAKIKGEISDIMKTPRGNCTGKSEFC